MGTIDAGGKTYEVDEEGYLIDLSQWNEDVAKHMAVEEKVDMTDNHWEVINFLRSRQIARAKMAQKVAA